MLTFLGIGAQKAGTTWLYQHLKTHPAIGFPDRKELHFWNRTDERDLDWYCRQFQSTTLREGEITPAYAFLPADRVAEIKVRFPDLRLIYLIRNPIDRAWSSAEMARRRAEMEPDEASFAWYRDHFRSRGSLARGCYRQAIETWRGCFSTSALLIETFDGLVDHPRALLRRCAAHIGADPGHFDTIPEAVLQTRVHSGDGVPMPDLLRAELRALYAGSIHDLSACLNIDLGRWLD